jgi:uncharacterized protein
MKPEKLACVLLVLLTNVASATDASYIAEVEKWHQDFDADVRNGGWLTGIGNFRIAEGTSTLGSASSSTMRLPAGHAPGSIGKLVRQGSVIKFFPARGIRVEIDGQPISKPQILLQSGGGHVQTGSIKFSARAYADDLYIFADDSANPAVADFAGNKWFPIDESYRVSAKFVAYDKPSETRVPMTHIEWKQPMTSTGEVLFKLDSQDLRLKTFVDEDQLLIMFTDSTNGHETYGGGRFIYAPLPKDGTTTLDFNKAFNPYCSLSQYVYCPVPPPENRLPFRVPVGEQFQGHD